MVDVTSIIVGIICIICGAIAAFGIPFLRSKLTVE
jgi:hypothetical protein